MTASTHSKEGQYIWLKAFTGKASYLCVELSAWFTFNLFCALGLFVIFFAALGGFELEGFFAHLANIANRFADAGEARRSSFGMQLVFSVLATVSMISLLRVSSFLNILKGLSDDK